MFLLKLDYLLLCIITIHIVVGYVRHQDLSVTDAPIEEDVPPDEDDIDNLESDTIQVDDGDMPHFVLLFKWFKNIMYKYRAFCAGSIIGEKRVLTSASCIVTNKKKFKIKLEDIKVVAGVEQTTAVDVVPDSNGTEQWRDIEKIHTQKYYRDPSFSLAILVLKTKFVFDDYIMPIPYASKNLNFDGVCRAVTIKALTSWATTKFAFIVYMQLLTRDECERSFLRDCHEFYCTWNKMHHFAYYETIGSGIVCHHTNDPAEKDKSRGILVGVTTVINFELPSMHTRVALFNKWITDGSMALKASLYLILICSLLNKYLC